MSIKRNTLYNVGGGLAPLVLTLVTVPLYLQAIGEARYGLLALVWLLLGYFGLFDLGLSTATANAVAKNRNGPPARRASIFATSLAVNAALGVLIGLIVLVTAPILLAYLGKGDVALRGEILAVLPWLAASVPLVTVGGVFGGVLTAHERFLTINLINIGGTILFQLAPLLAAHRYGPGLDVVIPAALLARAAPVLMMGAAALLREPLRRARFDIGILRMLLAYGGWVMVTNLISPLLASGDQFVIATMLGASAIAHYSVAYSLATRLQLLPSAVMQTMFPRLSQQSGEAARALSNQAARSMAIMMTILCVPAILLARPFLTWWLGEAFGQASAPVAEILLVSVWINGLAYIPFVLLQSQGRPDLIAKFHLAESIPFFIVLVALIGVWGLPGAALAWALRVAVDSALLMRAVRLPALHTLFLLPPAAAVALAWSLARCGPSRANVAVALTAGAALAIWGLWMDPVLRGWARDLLGKVRRRA